VFGLLLFCAGSIIAAMATSMTGIIIGRAVQGSGAIAGPIMALVADLTREVHRTKAMAMIGASIGLSFGAAIATGPVLAGWIGLHGIFWLIATLSIVAILVIVFVVPNPVSVKKHRDAEMVASSFTQVLANGELLRLNYGIFVLHALLSASFVVVPLLMRNAGLAADKHWQVYLPVFVVSFIAIVPFIILAEKKRRMKGVFLLAILTVAMAELGLMQFNGSLFGIVGFLCLFFTGFNLLEATLPSLVSKTAPGDMRGTAMGIYSTSQFLGAGLGGSIGGWCFGHYGASGVFLLCAGAAFSWLLLASTMGKPRYWSNMLLSLQGFDAQRVDQLVAEMLKVNGVENVTLRPDESVAYLKIDSQKLNKAELQQLITHYSIP
jgi:predicted MFS family arabinose efflux permease